MSKVTEITFLVFEMEEGLYFIPPSFREQFEKLERKSQRAQAAHMIINRKGKVVKCRWSNYMPIDSKRMRKFLSEEQIKTDPHPRSGAW